MTATAPVSARSKAADNAEVCLIGDHFPEAVLCLLGYSRWHVRQFADLATGLREIGQGRVAIALCGTKDWRKAMDEARRSSRGPAVIVLAETPNDREWLEVVDAGGIYLPVADLDAGHLFPLLSLQWRAWHGE
jgi:hypothetical protein